MHPHHRFNCLRLNCLRFVAALVLASPGLSHSAPRHVYLMLSEDASTGMGVHYHTLDPANGSFVHYDTVPRGGNAADYALTATGARRTIPGLADGRQIHGVKLTGLAPGAEYYFVAGDPEGGYSPENSFRTPPGGKAPVRFVVGGDMQILQDTRTLAARAAALDPAFAVIGGDLAYADGKLENVGRWDTWFDIWAEHMVTPDGHMIPMMLAIGNHEVNNLSTNNLAERAPFYTGFFWNQGEHSYFVRRVGGLVCLIALDSGHLVSHAAQAGFLHTVLSSHAEFQWKFPVYHVPLYPGHRDLDGAMQRAGRTYWAPLFEQHGVRYAFEHHDHVLKRTHPIRGHQLDPSGIVYIGDGAFGVDVRPVEPRWYLDIVESKKHFWLAEISEHEARIVAIDLDGNVYGDSGPQGDPKAAFPLIHPGAPAAGTFGLLLVTATLLHTGVRRRP